MTAKDKLFDIYANLMLEKRTNEKTVGDLCDEAEINRTSFYKNFKGAKDLESYVIRRYVHELMEEMSEGIEAKEYRDFDLLAVRFLTILERHRKYIEKGVFTIIRKGWLLDAFNVMFDSMLKITGNIENNDLRKWLAFNSANTMIFWGLIFIDNPDMFDFSERDEDILVDYIESFAKIADEDVDPYEIISPDKLDIMMTLIDGQFKKGEGAKNVSALCRDAGISRQSFYRQFFDLDDCKKQTRDLINSFASTIIKRNAFLETIPKMKMNIRRSFAPVEDFNLFSCSKEYVFVLAKCCFNICRKCCIILETTDERPLDRGLYFHLYFYLTAFLMTGVYQYYYSGTTFYSDQSGDMYSRSIKMLNDYRKSFPELDETLIWLGEHI